MIKKLYAVALMLGALVVTPSLAAVDMTIYYSETCPYCHMARDFAKNHLIYEYESLAVTQIDVTQEGNRDAFRKVVKDCGYASGGIPIVTIGDKCFQGYGGDDATGREFRDAIDGQLSADERAAAAKNRAALAENPDTYRTEHASRTDAIQASVSDVQKKTDKSPIVFWAILAVLVAGLGFVVFRKKKK